MTSKQKNNSSDKKVVIVGCGNYGRRLAITLTESGKEVVIIDKSRAKLEALSQLSINSDLLVGFLGDGTIAVSYTHLTLPTKA